MPGLCAYYASLVHANHSGARKPISMTRANPAPAQQATKITVRRVESNDQQQLQDFKSVTKSYLEWLGEDLGFQGTERELASLPGSYAAERGGCMLLAYESACNSTTGISEADGSSGGSSKTGGNGSGGESEQCVGAVALRSLAGHAPTLREGECISGVPLERACEMKRLFVMPGHHGRGVGAALSRELLAQAAQLGYQVMVLDTLERLSGANKLYGALGFEPCQRYNDNPLPGVLYFARRLDTE